jgi:gliding motility-associated-like protein
MKIKYLISFLLLGFLCLEIQASHLMGGNLGYEYLGLQPNGKYRYKVKLVTYVDCGPTSEIPYAEHPIKVGVYGNNILSPGSDKPVVDSLLLYIQDTTVYTPFLPPGCVIGANTCIIQVRYSGTIDLDPSTNGYYLFYERCCRNFAIINLNLSPNGSDAFLAYIPPTNIINNTPDFLYPPIPFLCVNDTTTIFNTAIDIDGDSLVYSFTTPFSGFGSTSDPLPHLPAPLLSWPIPPVDYAPGFSDTTPFSFAGNASINTANGVAQYFSVLQGTFVVCVRVDEYRNGVILSTTYRDLQLLFHNCPNNFAPHLVDNLQRDYQVPQGDTLCFPISFLDQENDSVFLEAHGDLFDTSFVDPIPSFTITLVDSNRASGDFCWIPPCTLDTGTYHFYMKSYDNGCPPKEKYEFYTVRITPPLPAYIMGSDSACIGVDSVLYWMIPDDGYVYNWDITGGNILQNYGDSVVVNWEIQDSAEIFVDVFTATGCYINSDSMTVTLIDVPSLLAMPEDTICSLDTLLLTAIGTAPYYWYPESSLIVPHEGDAEAIISQSGWFYVAGLPGELCPPSDSVYITTLDLPSVVATTSDSNICLGDTIRLFSSGAITYHWTPANSVFEPDSANTDAIPPSSQSYIIVGTDSNQCHHSDTVFVSVNPGPAINIDGDVSVCWGDTAFFTASGGASYQWSPNSYIYPDTGESVIVLVQVSSTVNLTATDSLGCKTDTMFTLTVNDLPNPSFTYDTLDIACAGAWIKFTNTTPDADHYQWNFGNGNQSADPSPQTLYPFGNTYYLSFTAYNSFGCSVTINDTLSTDSLQHLVNFNHVNVFTPDGNGTNDVLDFNLPDEFIDCSKVYVYDRWGMPMFESSTGNLSWDGKTDGKKVPEGVYFWIVEINGLQFQGFVHIFE